MIDPAGAFHRDGHSKGAVKLSIAALEELRAAADAILRVMQPGQMGSVVASRFGDDPRNPGWKVNNLWTLSPQFARLAASPAVVSELAHLTGATKIQIWRDQFLLKAPSSGGVVKWHQDAYWWSVLKPSNQVSVWVALDDVDVSNGAMRMIDQSHRWGLRTAEVRELNELAFLPANLHGLELLPRDYALRAGEMSYHHCATWHYSHPNESNKPRRGYAVHYLIDDTYLAAEAHHVIRDLITVNEAGQICGPLFPVLWFEGQYVNSLDLCFEVP